MRAFAAPGASRSSRTVSVAAGAAFLCLFFIVESMDDMTVAAFWKWAAIASWPEGGA